MTEIERFGAKRSGGRRFKSSPRNQSKINASGDFKEALICYK